MQLATQQQYLVKTSKNLIYHFFLNTDKSLHYSVYTSQSTILESKELVASIIEFSVAIDKYEKIHIIGVTKEGELVYYINQNDKWSHKTISKLDLKSNIYRNLMLFVKGGYTHIIYNKTNLLTPMLSGIEHIYWNQNGISKAVVGNYAHGRYPSPLQVSMDSLNNLHLVYKVYYKKNYQFYYSKFNVVSKKWNASELISNLQEDNSHPYIFIDNKDNLHLAWCIIEQNNFILKYKKKANITHAKLKWTDTQSLSNKNSNILSPIIVQESDTMKIYGKQNNQIIEIVSQDFGYSWKYLHGNIYKIEDPKIISFFNSQEAVEGTFVHHIYGNVGDKIEVAGISLFSNIEDPSISVNSKTPIEEVTIESALDTKIDIVTETIEQTEKIIDKTEEIMDEPSSVEEENLNQDQALNVAESDKSVDASGLNEDAQSQSIIDELVLEYKTLKNKLYEIEEEKQNFSKSISDCESILNLLEEKIVDYKKQMLTLQDKINDLTNNTNIFKRFINFFK